MNAMVNDAAQFQRNVHEIMKSKWKEIEMYENAM
jgi:hypothetical protein